MATRVDVRTRVSRNLGDPSFERFSQDSINTAIQEGYNLVNALIGTNQKSVHFPFPSDTPYINLRQYLPDYYSVVGIYNLTTNRWLNSLNHKKLNNLRWDWERWVGEPTDCYFVLDFNRIGIFPYQTVGSGTFFLLYNPAAETLTDTNLILLPETDYHVLEYYATADLLDDDREFGKALKYWDAFEKTLPAIEKQTRKLAAYDKNQILVPYLPLSLYGPGGSVAFVDGVVPTGTINGTNAVFTLPSIPNPTASLLLMKNGQVLFSGVGYNLSGATITYTSLYVPQVGDVHRVWYRIS